MTNVDKNRQLSPKQEMAIGLLINRKTQSEVAREVGVSRQTINQWYNGNSDFFRGITLRTTEIWSSNLERLRCLATQAIEVLASDLDAEDSNRQRQAAVHILKAIGLYGQDHSPLKHYLAVAQIRF